MDENKIAAQVAQNIPKEEHIPAPNIVEQPQPSAFDSNVPIETAAISTAVLDYFDIGRVEKYSEDTQRRLRDIYQWAAETAQSQDPNAVLQTIRAVELELGISFAPDRLIRLAKFVKLKRQSNLINTQLGALYG